MTDFKKTTKYSVFNKTLRFEKGNGVTVIPKMHKGNPIVDY